MTAISWKLQTGRGYPFPPEYLMKYAEKEIVSVRVQEKNYSTKNISDGKLNFYTCRKKQDLQMDVLSVNQSTPVFKSVSLLIFAQKNLTCMVEILQTCLK